MTELGRRPSTTCGYKMKRARKAHRCNDCRTQIESGRLYFQDDYYAPFGNGLRYCLSCAQSNQQAETEWLLRMPYTSVISPEEKETLT